MKRSVDIIIPNHNGSELLRQNLPRVLKEAKTVDAKVFVCDDASSDTSVETINCFPQITLFQTRKRSGFAASVNRAIKMTKGEIVVLLNSDVCPEKEFLLPLLPHFSDPGVFAVGCLDKSIEEGGTVYRGRGIGVFKKGFLNHDRGDIGKSSTLWVSAGSGAFRRSIWQELGGFDELFAPFYYEDIDLSYRAQKAGCKIVFEATSVVVHKHREGAIQKLYLPGFIKTVSYRNQFLFYWKNISSQQLLVQHLWWMPYHLLSATIRLDGAFFIGFLMALCCLPQIISRRKKIAKLWRKKDEMITIPYQDEMA